MGQFKIDPTQILVYLHDFEAFVPTSAVVRYCQTAAFAVMLYDWCEHDGPVQSLGLFAHNIS